MLVVCVYAANQARGVPGLHAETKTALERRCGYPVEFFNVTNIPDGYWQVLNSAWRRCYEERDSLCVIEHDIVVRRSVFDEFDNCPRPWCGFPYEIGSGVQMALGCTRFSSELIGELPHAIEQAGERTDDGEPRRCWVRMDTRLQAELMSAGYGAHEHGPPVLHLNRRQRMVKA